MTMNSRSPRPHIVFVFSDQWRGQAFGFAGDPNARTPHTDAFAAQPIHFPNAVSGCPVCSPYRASLLSGRYPLAHGIIVNDQPLRHVPGGSLADHLNAAGYDTLWIGKWHLHSGGRRRFVLPEHRLGFRFWRGYECTHDYQHSFFFADTPEPLLWKGYDAQAQTDLACTEIEARAHGRHPFALFLSWGPPHNPYDTAPEPFQSLFPTDTLRLAPNVPPGSAETARTDLAGYYAHGAALDACFGRLLDALDAQGIADRTVVIFTSDHGDMHGAQGRFRKQWPFEESIRVPFLLRWPAGLGTTPRTFLCPIDAPDLMPTILGLLRRPIPPQCQGRNWAPLLRGEAPDEPDTPAPLSCYCPFHELHRSPDALEYRGLRTAQTVYVERPDGPWLLFDIQRDPFQLRNLVAEVPRDLIADLHRRLHALLTAIGDVFEPGPDLLRRYHVRLNEQGDVFYE